jgi:hypothetical protein
MRVVKPTGQKVSFAGAMQSEQTFVTFAWLPVPEREQQIRFAG